MKTHYNRNGEPEIHQVNFTMSYCVFEDPFDSERIVAAQENEKGSYTYARAYPLWLVIA